MSRILLSTGNYAEIPYFFEKTYVNLYSAEELCYALVENVELLDQDIVSDKLARWLDEQCGLSKLAHALYGLVNQKCSVSAYVGTILEYIGLYPADVISHIETIIKNSAGMNPYERQKAKADYMLQNNRYVIAIERYDELLLKLPRREKKIRGEALHNRGVANAKLFLFEHAQEDFMTAYRTNGSMESLKQFLIARRMLDDDKKYVEYIAEHPDLHAVSLQVERAVEQAAGQFEMTDENRMLFTLRVCKEESSAVSGGVVQYYEEIEKLTASLKGAYRESVAR
mgnify:CR=1 FL=1